MSHLGDTRSSMNPSVGFGVMRIASVEKRPDQRERNCWIIVMDCCSFPSICRCRHSASLAWRGWKAGSLAVTGLQLVSSAAPKASALPNCATPRRNIIVMADGQQAASVCGSLFQRLQPLVANALLKGGGHSLCLGAFAVVMLSLQCFAVH